MCRPGRSFVPNAKSYAITIFSTFGFLTGSPGSKECRTGSGGSASIAMSSGWCRASETNPIGFRPNRLVWELWEGAGRVGRVRAPEANGLELKVSNRAPPLLDRARMGWGPAK